MEHGVRPVRKDSTENPHEQQNEVSAAASDTPQYSASAGHPPAPAKSPSENSEDTFDPEWSEVIEREEIVHRYQLGPEQLVEDWENPQCELHHADRFGFLSRAPSTTSTLKSTKSRSKSTKKSASKLIERERRREMKWLPMLRNYPQFSRSVKFQERVWKGVPDSLRSEVWRFMLGVNTCDEHGRQRPTFLPGIYDQLKARALLCAKELKQIDLDVNRTYRDHRDFTRRYNSKQQSLLNVLSAYAVYNVDVGYCQGMSHIVALLLMYVVEEEDAFWMLHRLMDDRRYFMQGFFRPGFPKLARFQAHFDKLLSRHLRRVRKNLDQQQVPPIYLTKWFFGCFLDRVPFSLAMRLWDVFMLEGDMVLLAAAFTVMKMHNNFLRKAQVEDVMEFFQSRLCDDFGYPDDVVMRAVQENLRKLLESKELPPPAASSQETHITERGSILRRDVADIKAEQMKIASRRTSRANSTRQSIPATPNRNRAHPLPSNSTTTLSTQKRDVTFRRQHNIGNETDNNPVSNVLDPHDVAGRISRLQINDNSTSDGSEINRSEPGTLPRQPSIYDNVQLEANGSEKNEIVHVNSIKVSIANEQPKQFTVTAFNRIPITVETHGYNRPSTSGAYNYYQQQSTGKAAPENRNYGTVFTASDYQKWNSVRTGSEPPGHKLSPTVESPEMRFRSHLTGMSQSAYTPGQPPSSHIQQQDHVTTINISPVPEYRNQRYGSSSTQGYGSSSAQGYGSPNWERRQRGVSGNFPSGKAPTPPPDYPDGEEFRLADFWGCF